MQTKDKTMNFEQALSVMRAGFTVQAPRDFINNTTQAFLIRIETNKLQYFNFLRRKWEGLNLILDANMIMSDDWTIVKTADYQSGLHDMGDELEPAGTAPRVGDTMILFRDGEESCRGTITAIDDYIRWGDGLSSHKNCCELDFNIFPGASFRILKRRRDADLFNDLYEPAGTMPVVGDKFTYISRYRDSRVHKFVDVSDTIYADRSWAYACQDRGDIWTSESLRGPCAWFAANVRILKRSQDVHKNKSSMDGSPKPAQRNVWDDPQPGDVVSSKNSRLINVEFVTEKEVEVSAEDSFSWIYTREQWAMFKLDGWQVVSAVQ